MSFQSSFSVHYFVLTACVSLHLCEVNDGKSNKMQSGTFTMISGCEKGLYYSKSYKHFAVFTRIQCARACLSDPVCSSINMADQLGDQGDGPRELYCLLFDSAAQSCKEISKDESWVYMRLTDYQGAERVGDNTGTEAPPHISQECQCSSWEMVYEILNNEEQGNKQNFLEQLRHGAMISISVRLPPDGLYHRLTPLIHHMVRGNNINNEPETVYFEFPPRQFIEYVNGNYITFQDYIGISTHGKLSVRTFSMDGDLKKEKKVDLYAQFFTRKIECSADGMPTYMVGSAVTPPGDVGKLIVALSRGSDFMVHLENGLTTTAMQGVFTSFDRNSHVISIAKHRGILYSSDDPTQAQEPLIRCMQVIKTSGVVETLTVNIQLGKYSSSRISDSTQSWYVNSCWKMASVTYTDGSEDKVYNSSNVFGNISRGASVRVEFLESDQLTTRPIRALICGKTACMGYLDGSPVMNDGQIEFDSVVSQLSGLQIKTYHALNSSTTTTVLTGVRWFVDAIDYKEVFVVENDKVMFENLTLTIVGGTGVNLLLTIEYQNLVRSFEVVDASATGPEGGNNYMFYTADVNNFESPTKGCTTEPATRSVLLLQTYPVSLTYTAWSMDWRIICTMNEPFPYTKATLFASK